MKYIALALASTAFAAAPLLAQSSSNAGGPTSATAQASGQMRAAKNSATSTATSATGAPVADTASATPPAASSAGPAAPGALSTDANAQSAGAATQGAAPAGGATGVTVGAQVADAQGGAVGTIESVSGGNAVLSTGTAKATLPVTAFAQGANGLVIGMTKAEVEAAVAKAAGGAQTASSTGAAGGATATGPASITVGAQVNDTKGGKVGTVEAVSGDLVTVATANIKAQLPKAAFAQGANGLMIAMTASELEAAAKSAAPAPKTGR